MSSGSEVERRRELVRLVEEEGVAVAVAARQLGRSREWAHKWIRRHRDAGEAGLVDVSRAPLHRPTELDPETVARIVELRGELEAHRHANRGGITILARLEDEGWEPLPSLRSIERVLARNELTKPFKKKPSGPKNRLPLPDVAGQPGVYQQADWIQDRYLRGGVVFNSLQISDVGSHMMCAGQYPRRYLRNAVGLLVEEAWPVMGIPQALGTDNAFVKTSHSNNPWTSWTKTCLYHGAEVIVAPPGGLGWTNHIESVNNLWQDRTIHRHHYDDLDAVRHDSQAAVHWFNHQRAIVPTRTGTRYPAQLVANHHHQLRWPQLDIDDIFNPEGECILPLTTGRITYIRIVEDQTIEVTNNRWKVPLTDASLVTATISTSDHQLTITHQAEPIVRYPYPIKHRIVDPLHPPAEHSLLTHI